MVLQEVCAGTADGFCQSRAARGMVWCTPADPHWSEVNSGIKNKDVEMKIICSLTEQIRRKKNKMKYILIS